MTIANDITFGIEIETTMPRDAIAVGGYHRGIQATDFPTGWLTMYDASITTSRGRVGCEFVSPVLKGAEGLRQVIEVCNKIKALGGRVNQSTGVHVHIGFDRTNENALKRLVTLIANFEKAIYASTGTRSRENGRWAYPIRHAGNADAAIVNGHSDRYRLLNLTSLLQGRRPTVEFRAFAGTLNAAKLIGHIRMCVGLVERAITAKRITTWVAKETDTTSPVYRKSGAGCTCLTRLFYQLGWTKGRRNDPLGNVTCDDGPDLANTKRTLMKLAKKYDNAA